MNSITAPQNVILCPAPPKGGDSRAAFVKFKQSKQMEYYYKNREKVLARQKIRNQIPEIREARLRQRREWYQKNKARKLELDKQWRVDNPERWKELTAWKNRTKASKLAANLRKRVRDMIKSSGRSPSTEKLIGCTKEEYIKWIESQFTEGMSWGNYGEWHIDHIRPCSSFDLSNSSEAAKCMHYTNTQPLWAEDNIAKGNKIVSKNGTPPPGR